MTTEEISREKKKIREEVEQEYVALNATFKVVAKVLAIRFFLFLSLIGSFILSIYATNTQSTQSAWVLVLYALVTTLPLTILEFANRRMHGG